MSDADTTWRALTTERLRFIFVDSSTFGVLLDVVSTVAIGFAGVAGVFFPDASKQAIVNSLVIGACLFFWGRIRSHRRSRKISDLRAQIATLEQDKDRLREDLSMEIAETDSVASAIEQFASGVLKQLATDHGLTANERVTLYTRDGDSLRVVARYSTDMSLATIGEYSRGHRYTVKDGLVGRCLQRNERVTVQAAEDPLDGRRYRPWQALNGLDADAVATLRMRSLAYDVHPVRNSGGEVGGVIVLESLHIGRPCVSDLGDKLASPHTLEMDTIARVTTLMGDTLRKEKEA